MSEKDIEMPSGSPEPEKKSRIVELINDAAMAPVGQKLECLIKAQELLLHSKDVLLDNFLNEMMDFQRDRSQEVRKFVVGFIEQVCKKDPDLLPDVIVNLQMMIGDEVVVVQKRVIQAMTHIYKVALGWISKAKSLTDNMEAVWTVVCKIKDIILTLLDSENDGIRTYAVKFMEMLIITQTHVEEDSMKRPNDMSLSDVPLTLKIARPRKLEEEARQVFEQLVKYHGSSHISSANLMTCMGALTNIAKVRPQFMPKVITALEMLQANLPPTLAKSQVSSVRKHLKNQLLALLKHNTAAENFLTNITTLLTDLGASREEVLKARPKLDEMKRKARKAAAERAKESLAEPQAKKAKVEEASDDDDDSDNEEKEVKFSQSAVDITEKFILQRMNPTVAAEIVMRSMRDLPRDIPPQFHNTYTPIAAAGTEGQVKHVSRLLATQLTAAGIGPGVEQANQEKTAIKEEEEDEEEPRKSRNLKRKKEVTLLPAGVSKKPLRSRTLKLNEITKPLESEEKNNMIIGSLKRILQAERSSVMGGVPKIRNKIITTLAAQSSSSVKTFLLGYIFEDIKSRTELAFSWLYEEYCFYQGFSKASSMYTRRTDSEYNAIFCHLIRGVIERCKGGDREALLRRLYLESPIITEDAITILKQFVQVESNAITVVNLMKDLVMKRPTKKLNFLNFLLEFCSHETKQVRKTANQIVLQLHANGDFIDVIEDYSVMYLRFLLNPTPPAMLFGEDRGRPLIEQAWTEDTVKVCLYLFMSLLPQSKKLIKHLANVYSGDKKSAMTYVNSQQKIVIQRTILRELDYAVSDIPITSPELLDLVENCPEGAEILVTRIVHILTEKQRPPQPLVDKFRDLYKRRMSDVRLLIPVLTGLTKQEIMAALPDLIQLSPGVVKEVFSRLMGTSTLKGPFSAADLMVALHLIDVNKKDKETMVPAVKKAIDQCFKERRTYTQEVLSIVLQQLLEEVQIPFFMMRTIIQSLKFYPKMVGFIMNVLQKLILKQVWKNKVIWDGFIKTCKETVPQSYAVMLQLPNQQLRDFFEKAPLLREPLLEHVQGFNESQRAHVSAGTMAVLYNVKNEQETAPQSAEDVDSDAPPPGE